MIFYGNGIVWDKFKNAPLAKFKKGILETDDPDLIEKLLELHYNNDGKFPLVKEDQEPVEIEGLNNWQTNAEPSIYPETVEWNGDPAMIVESKKPQTKKEVKK